MFPMCEQIFPFFLSLARPAFHFPFVFETAIKTKLRQRRVTIFLQFSILFHFMFVTFVLLFTPLSTCLVCRNGSLLDCCLPTVSFFFFAMEFSSFSFIPLIIFDLALLLLLGMNVLSIVCTVYTYSIGPNKTNRLLDFCFPLWLHRNNFQIDVLNKNQLPFYLRAKDNNNEQMISKWKYLFMYRKIFKACSMFSVQCSMSYNSYEV